MINLFYLKYSNSSKVVQPTTGKYLLVSASCSLYFPNHTQKYIQSEQVFYELVRKLSSHPDFNLNGNKLANCC
jgi:hypothetical protein